MPLKLTANKSNIFFNLKNVKSNQISMSFMFKNISNITEKNVFWSSATLPCTAESICWGVISLISKCEPCAHRGLLGLEFRRLRSPAWLIPPPYIFHLFWGPPVVYTKARPSYSQPSIIYTTCCVLVWFIFNNEAGTWNIHKLGSFNETREQGKSPFF